MNSNDVNICAYHSGNSDDLVKALDSIRENTQIDYRLIILLDGADTEVKAVAKKWLADVHTRKSALLVANQGLHGFSHCLKQAIGIAAGAREYFVIVRPGVTIKDKNWIGKLTIPFKDQQCFIAYADPNEMPNSKPPFPIPKSMKPTVAIAMFRRPWSVDIDVTDLHDPWLHTSSKAVRSGRRIYLCPSVRFGWSRLATPKFKAKPADVAAEILIDR